MTLFVVIMVAWVACLTVALVIYRRHRRRHPLPLDPAKMSAHDWLKATRRQPATPPYGTPTVKP